MPSIKRLYESPTLNTWGSYFTKTASLVVVLPLLLAQFKTDEIALWYLFASIIGLQSLADIGFSPTFSRVISYAMGGAATIADLSGKKQTESMGQPNWFLANHVWSTTRAIYFWLSIISSFILLLVGSLFLMRPIALSSNPTNAWIAWLIILLTSGITFWNGVYAILLQGTNNIALFRRWEMLFSLATIFTSFIVLILKGDLLQLVIANQLWAIFSVIRNKWLCGKIEVGRFKKQAKRNFDRKVFNVIWPAAWRSGIGVLMSYGLVQSTNIVYAQFGNSAQVASYSLALRLLQSINVFSQAPFYSKLPILARLWLEGKNSEQILLAKKGMALAYWAFVLPFVFIGVSASFLLKSIGSNADFVSPTMWLLLGLAFFSERFGAMHSQLYSCTNKVIWHIANGVSGIINVLVVLITYKSIGVYAFPIGILSGYFGFYCWYSAMHSYREFKMDFWNFESRTSLLPFMVMITYIVIVIIFN